MTGRQRTRSAAAPNPPATGPYGFLARVGDVAFRRREKRGRPVPHSFRSLISKLGRRRLRRRLAPLPAAMRRATGSVKGPFGPVIHELTELFPHEEIIDRSLMDAWQDERVRRAVARTGRRKVIIAGLALGVCGTLPALSAMADGYAAYVVIDASGDFDAFPFTEITRLSQAGAIAINSGPLVMELLADNADPRAEEVYAALGRSPGAFLSELTRS